MEKRIYWIDYAKSLCIFLVVLGHSQIPTSYKSIFYVFHIPLFFFISGTLFSFEKYAKYSIFLKKRIFQLVIPYFFFNTVTYLFWLFIGRKVGDDISLGHEPLKQFIGIFWGNDANHFLEHCAPLWFLTCLFVVENLFYLTFHPLNKIQKYLGVVFFVIIGYIDYKFNPYRFPWGINVAFTTVIFYALGALIRNWTINQNKNSVVSLLILFFISSLGVLLVNKLNGKIEVSVGYYGNYGYFLLGALCGICWVISCCKLIAQYFGNIRVFQFIGANTLIILGFHILAGSSLKAFSYYILQLPLSIYSYAYISLFYSMLSIIILLPVMVFMNKYIGVVIGKKKS